MGPELYATEYILFLFSVHFLLDRFFLRLIITWARDSLSFKIRNRNEKTEVDFTVFFSTFFEFRGQFSRLFDNSHVSIAFLPRHRRISFSKNTE